MRPSSLRRIFSAGLIFLLLGLALILVKGWQLRSESNLLEIEANLTNEVQRNYALLDLLGRSFSQESLLQVDLNEFEGDHIYAFKDSQLIFWSKNDIVPDLISVGSDSISFMEKDGWKYLLLSRRTYLQSEPVDLIAIIPLVIDPLISNKYLQLAYNQRIFSSPQFYLKVEVEQEFRPVTIEGRDPPIFAIEIGSGYREQNILVENLSLTLIWLGILLLGTAVYVWLARSSIKENWA